MTLGMCFDEHVKTELVVLAAKKLLMMLLRAVKYYVLYNTCKGLAQNRHGTYRGESCIEYLAVIKY